MKKVKFAEEQIIGFLRQAEADLQTKELCCNGGFGGATLSTLGVQGSAACMRLRPSGCANMNPRRPLRRLLAKADQRLRLRGGQAGNGEERNMLGLVYNHPSDVAHLHGRIKHSRRR